MKYICSSFLFFLLSTSLFAQNCNKRVTIKIDAPDGSYIDDIEICKLTSLNLSLNQSFSSSATYQWYCDKQFIGSTTPSHKVEKTGMYYAIIKEGNCTYQTNNFKVNLRENIVPNIFFDITRTEQKDFLDENYVICSKGGGINLFAISNTVFKNISLQWIKDNQDIPYANDHNYFATEPGKYSLRIKQDGCQAISRQLRVDTSSNFNNTKLVVNDYLIGNDTLTFCQGMLAKLSIDRVSDTRRWYKDGIEMGNTANLNKVEVKQSGNYQVSFNYGGCSIKTKPVYIEFGNTLPPSEINSQWSSNCTLSLGSNMIARDYTAGYNIYQYNWIKDGVNIATTKGGLLVRSAGDYQVFVNMDNGCKSKISPKFTVSGKPIIRLYSRSHGFIRDKKIEICSGNFLDLGTASNGSFTNVVWFKDGKEVSSGSLDYFTIGQSGKYHSVCYSEGCSIISDTLEVIVRPALNTTYSSDCGNEKTTISVLQNSSYSYQWYRNNELILNANKYQFNVTSRGEYHVSINDAVCSIQTSPISIGSRIEGKLQFCEGETLELTTTAHTNNQWYSPKGFVGNGTSILIQQLTSADAGLYRLRSAFGTNCSYTDSVYVTVNKHPTFDITSSINKNAICEGKNINLTVSNYSFQNQDFYTWKNPRGQIFSYNKDVRLNTLKVSDAGEYSLEIKSQSGCSSTKIFNLEVIPTAKCPSISIGAMSEEQCHNATFDVPFTTNAISELDTFVVLLNNPDPKYGIVIGKGTKSPIKAVFPSTYYVTSFYVYALKQGVVSEKAQRIVAKEQTEPFINYQYLGACTGKDVALKLSDNVVSKYQSYEWYNDSGEKIAQNQQTIQVNKTGSYSVKALQKNGCLMNTSTPAKVQIGTIKEPVIWTESSPYVCDGGKVNLTSLGYAPDVKFQWKIDNKIIDDVNALKSTYTAEKTGYYSLQIQQGDCVAESQNVFISIGKILNPSINKDELNYNIPFGQLLNPSTVEICDGSSVNLIYDSRVKTYSVREYDYYKSAFYITDPNIINGSTKIVWQKDGKDITDTKVIEQNMNYFNTFFYVKDSGEYRVKATNGNCVAYSEPMNVVVKSKIKVKLRTEPTANVCEGKTVAISHTTLPNYDIKEFDWYKDDKKYFDQSSSPVYTTARETGNYYGINKYQINDKVCEFQSDTVSIKIGGKVADLAFMYLPDDVITCEDTIQLQTQYYYLNSSDFIWKKDDRVIANANKGTLKITQPGVYQAEYKIDNNCQAISKPYKVTFKSIKPNIVAENNIICATNAKVLNAYINNYGYKDIHTYQWYRNGAMIPNSTNFRLITAQEGNYVVNLKYKDCSSNSEVFSLKKSSISDEIFPKDSIGICPNEMTELKVNKYANEKFTWLKNDSLLQNGTNIINVAKSGVYKAIVSDNNCAVETNTVKVNERIILPTATLSGDRNLTYGDTTNLKVLFTSTAPWTFKLNDGKEISTDKNPYSILVNPIQTTTYELLSVKNICGEGKVFGKADIKIIILGTETIENVNVSVFPNPLEEFCSLEIKSSTPTNISYTIVDSQGRIIKTISVKDKRDYLNDTINLSNLPAGVYHLSLRINDKVLNRNIIKLK